MRRKQNSRPGRSKCRGRPSDRRPLLLQAGFNRWGSVRVLRGSGVHSFRLHSLGGGALGVLALSVSSAMQHQCSELRAAIVT